MKSGDLDLLNLLYTLRTSPKLLSLCQLFTETKVVASTDDNLPSGEIDYHLVVPEHQALSIDFDWGASLFEWVHFVGR